MIYATLGCCAMEAENVESMDLESLKNLVEESIEDLVLEKMGSSLDRPIMSIARKSS